MSNTATEMKPSEKVQVRARFVICTDHPEWGKKGVMEDFETHFVLSGGLVVTKEEFGRFWQVVA